MVINALYQLYRLRKNQWLPLAELKQIQFKKLKKMISYVYTNVTYYQRLFDSIGLRPEDIKKLEDIKKIPITRKSDLKNLSLTELLSKNANIETLIKRSTAGSTGVHFTVYHLWEDKVLQALMNLWILMENGLGIMDKIAHIINTRQLVGQRLWFQSLGILRKYYVQASNSIDEQLAILRKINLNVIYGYPSSIK